MSNKTLPTLPEPAVTPATGDKRRFELPAIITDAGVGTTERFVEEVRKAYKELVKIYHRDRLPNDPRLRDTAQENSSRSIKHISTSILRAFLRVQVGLPPKSGQIVLLSNLAADSE